VGTLLQGFGVCDQLAGHNDYFFNNTVVQVCSGLLKVCVRRPACYLAPPAMQTQSGNYANGQCTGPTMVIVGNNSIYTPNGQATECGTSVQNWVAQGHDQGTTVSVYPQDSDLLQWARNVLGM
jgi:hypothetical protein